MSKEKPSISAEDILTAEFEYIAQTASQANDDRSSVVSFFVIAVGSPLAAFFSADLAQIPEQAAYLLFMGLFLILAILAPHDARTRWASSIASRRRRSSWRRPKRSRTKSSSARRFPWRAHVTS